MEVTLATTEASSVLNTVSDLISGVIDLHPGHKDMLLPHWGEIDKAQRVTQLIRTQKGLQTSGVVAGLRMLQSHGDILKKDLVSLGEGEDKDEHDFGITMKLLKDERKNLVQQIRIAGVGLAKVDGVITVDTKVVKSTDEATKKSLGKGLDILRFLSKLKREPDEKGKIRLTDIEYEDWTWQQIKTCHSETKTLTKETKTRISANCLARGQSIQILGPIGRDLWAGVAFVKTEGLVSMDQSIQLGYAQDFNVLREVLDRQDKRIASTHVKAIGA